MKLNPTSASWWCSGVQLQVVVYYHLNSFELDLSCINQLVDLGVKCCKATSLTFNNVSQQLRNPEFQAPADAEVPYVDGNPLCISPEHTVKDAYLLMKMSEQGVPCQSRGAENWYQCSGHS